MKPATTTTTAAIVLLALAAGCAPAGRVVSVNDGTGQVFDYNCDKKLLKPMPGLMRPMITTEVKEGVWYSQEEMRKKNPGLETGGWYYTGDEACK